MKRFISTFAAAALAAALAGCASPTYYQANTADSPYQGYADSQVDGSLFRVSYLAYPSANADQIYAFALYRAAELARSKGATHFEVLEGPVNKPALERFIAKPEKVAFDEGSENTFTIINTSAGRGRGRGFGSSPFFAVPLTPPPPPRQVSLLIRLLNAPSLDIARGFDVNDLLTRIGAKIARPPVKSA